MASLVELLDFIKKPCFDKRSAQVNTEKYFFTTNKREFDALFKVKRTYKVL